MAMRPQTALPKRARLPRAARDLAQQQCLENPNLEAVVFLNPGVADALRDLLSDLDADPDVFATVNASGC